MENWHIFAALGVILVILEIFTPSFFMLPAGVAFLLTAAWAPLLDSLTANIGVLALHLIVIYTIFYLWVWPRMSKKAPQTNASGMSGQIATVTEAVRPDGTSGYVKLYGDSWRAISEHSFEIGERVVILRTDGNKVVVGPVASA